MTDQTEQLTPTAGVDWRQPRKGYPVKLYSGNVASLRPVAVDTLLLQGELPDILGPIAARSLWVETSPDTMADNPELAKGFAELVNFVVRAAMVYPRVVDEPAEGAELANDEITLADIDFNDKITIFRLASAGVDALRSFREQQAPDVGDLSDGENVRAAAV